MSQATTETRPEPFARFWALFERADYWLLWLERAAMGIAALILAGVFISLMLGVFGRPWTGLLFSISLEGGAMSLWPISYMGAGYIWRIYGHVQFDLALRKSRFRKHHLIQFINTFGAFVVGGLLAWLGWHSFMWQWDFKVATQNLRYQHWPLFWPAFIGTGILATELLFSLGRHLREILHPTGSEDAIYGVYREGGPGGPVV